MEMTASLKTRLEKQMSTHRDKFQDQDQLTQYGYLGVKDKEFDAHNDICFARVGGDYRGAFKETANMLFYSIQRRGKEGESYARCRTPEAKEIKLTLPWVEFLLSKHSPWEAVLPGLAISDPEWISTYGWVWNDLSTVPPLAYNFLIATRQCYEFQTCHKNWMKLAKEGIRPDVAAYISIHYLEQDGKWMEACADSHTWGAGYDTTNKYARRFINHDPLPEALKCFSKTKNWYHYRCAQIWGNGEIQYADYYNPPPEKKGLSLDELITKLMKIVGTKERKAA